MCWNMYRVCNVAGKTHVYGVLTFFFSVFRRHAVLLFALLHRHADRHRLHRHVSALHQRVLQGQRAEVDGH
jgi:hypothetical protein